MYEFIQGSFCQKPRTVTGKKWEHISKIHIETQEVTKIIKARVTKTTFRKTTKKRKVNNKVQEIIKIGIKIFYGTYINQENL
jgi:hypothetical protein